MCSMTQKYTYFAVLIKGKDQYTVFYLTICKYAENVCAMTI
jgi:hypothetical protein